jgi:1-deoxy-D-xylulose-5-phosphate synthase
MSVAEHAPKKKNNCVAVIMTVPLPGYGYEAMNWLDTRSRMIVVLNDNGQVSLPTGNRRTKTHKDRQLSVTVGDDC